MQGYEQMKIFFQKYGYKLKEIEIFILTEKFFKHTEVVTCCHKNHSQKFGDIQECSSYFNAITRINDEKITTIYCQLIDECKKIGKNVKKIFINEDGIIFWSY